MSFEPSQNTVPSPIAPVAPGAKHDSRYTLPPTPPERGDRPPRKNKKLPLLIVGGAVVLGISTMAACLLLVIVFAASVDRIPDGVRVGAVEIGGDRMDDAESALAAAYGASVPQMVQAIDGDRSWTIFLSDIGGSIDLDDTLSSAENARENARLQPVYNVDIYTAQNGLIALSAMTDIEAIPDETNPQTGRALDIPAMMDRLRLNPSGELADGILDLTMIEVAPPEYDPAEHYEGPVLTHTVQAGQELALIAREYGVTINELVAFNDITDIDLIYPGQELLIPSSGEYTPDPPPAPRAQGKAIVVDTNEQRIYAYQDGTMIYSQLVSTGTQLTPTVKGDYNIYVKYVADDMSGPDYFLPQVPWTMYFYQGYAIHGTYWHNSFGRPMSHGCVNLPPDEAQWFFNFAEVGTLVRVI